MSESMLELALAKDEALRRAWTALSGLTTIDTPNQVVWKLQKIMDEMENAIVGLPVPKDAP